MDQPRQELTRYDPAERKRSVRRGRERGVWVFIPAHELREAGIDPHGPAPLYRLWGRRGGSILGRLYQGDSNHARPSNTRPD